jgi:7,8-dihydro-6-hydroxymethylpterin-pyrophosphokinase
VLTPLYDIRPDLLLPGQQKTVADLLAALAEPAAVKLFAAEW